MKVGPAVWGWKLASFSAFPSRGRGSEWSKAISFLFVFLPFLSRSSTTSLKASSKVKSSDPSLYFNTRQREGKFFNQGFGEKGTTSLTSGSGPCDTNVSLSLFQAEMLNDPDLSLPKTSRGLKACFESANVWARLVVYVFRSETLHCKVEVGMLVRPASVLKGAGFV